MSGLFGVLGIASRSMGVTQAGIRTTGHNIANVNTPGYSRQVQNLQPALPISSATGQLGTGVEQGSIDRVTDLFVQRQLVQEHASGGALTVQSQALAAIEEVVNEQQGEGVAAALGELYAAFGDLASAATPGAAAERQALVGVAQRFVDSLHRADARLREQQGGADRAINATVNEINSLTDRIAELNEEIVRRETIAPANDLRDQRELLLRDLSRKVEINTFEEPNGATVVLLAAGPTLVERNVSRDLVVAPDLSNPFDPTFSRVLQDFGSGQIDVTADIGGGELGGLLRVRDTLIPSAIRSLDVLAYNAVDSINAQHGAGFGLDGSTGNDFFEPRAAVEDSARDIAVAAGIVANTDTIAAGGSGPDPGDNANALALASLRDAAVPLALPGDPPGPPSGPSRTLLEHVATIVSDVGFSARTFSDATAQHERVLEILETRREEVSGVSLDEEVTNLVRLQAAFQASARVVSVVDRLLQDVVDLI